MPQITVNGNRIITCEKGANLYEALSFSGYLFPGSCGGLGRCKRCEVQVKNVGVVKSCEFVVDDDVEVEINEATDAGIVASYVGAAAAVKGVGDAFTIAIDLGTTTIAMELIDSTGKTISTYSCLNSQISVGADVVSRIKAAGDEAGLKKVRDLVLWDIAKGVEKFTAEVPSSKDNILKYVIAGNTTMLSIIEGLTTENLFGYPFEMKNGDVVEMNLEGAGDARILCLPNLSAFLGADVLAGAAALNIARDNSYRMLIDLGTNGEIIIANNVHGVATSTACGSTFEGCFKSANVYGSNIFDMLALLRKRNQIDKDGNLPEEYFESGIKMGQNITIDMDIIRSFQLGKAAIFAGITLLMKELEISAKDIAEVYVAGGFGFHLNLENAIYLGMFPKEFEGKLSTKGNTSLYGAHRAAVEGTFVAEIEELKSKLTYVDLSNKKEFNELYVNSLQF